VVTTSPDKIMFISRMLVRQEVNRMTTVCLYKYYKNAVRKYPCKSFSHTLYKEMTTRKEK